MRVQNYLLLTYINIQINMNTNNYISVRLLFILLPCDIDTCNCLKPNMGYIGCLRHRLCFEAIAVIFGVNVILCRLYFLIYSAFERRLMFYNESGDCIITHTIGVTSYCCRYICFNTLVLACAYTMYNE